MRKPSITTDESSREVAKRGNQRTPILAAPLTTHPATKRERIRGQTPPLGAAENEDSEPNLLRASTNLGPVGMARREEARCAAHEPKRAPNLDFQNFRKFRHKRKPREGRCFETYQVDCSAHLAPTSLSKSASEERAFLFASNPKPEVRDTVPHAVYPRGAKVFVLPMACRVPPELAQTQEFPTRRRAAPERLQMAAP